MKHSEHIQNILKDLPKDPGVYKFFDKENTLIYVGKAKNLKNRVSSYFQAGSDHNYKTKRLVSKISNIEFTILNSEFDAFLLENSLIKENQPKYNIQLKDDKSFPFICILDERFPRIISTRRYKKYKGKYFGPYANVKAINTVLELIRKLYTIRTCTFDLSEKNIEANKYKICLEHHIGNCLGPCEGLQSEEDYKRDIEQAQHILKGNIHLCTQYFKDKMKTHAERLEFEKANAIKTKLQRLEKFQSKTQIIQPSLTDHDVFSITSTDKKAFINYLKISNGSIIVTQNFEVQKKLDETDAEILRYVIIDTRKKFDSASSHVIGNVALEPLEDVEYNVPKIGDKRKIVDLSLKNALQYKNSKVADTPATPNHIRVLETLQKDLRLPTLPKHIECFDNSNIQGTSPVASMVCFLDGKPAKKEYRHYNIRSVVGPDDFASMKEILFRRYKRLSDENKPFPELIIVDGGKGQLSSACESLKELNLYGKIPIVGIAKKLEEIYYPEDSDPLHINRKSESLRLIQHIRNEAHRFAITFHRQKRSQNVHQTSLSGISGIGKKTEQQLIRHFKTIKKIKSASVDDLSAVVGKAKAEQIFQHFHN